MAELPLDTDAGAEHDTDSPPRHVFLIDGSGFIFRAFFALPDMRNSEGVPVNAVMGFCNMLMKLINETDADCIVCAFDHSGKSFRNEIYQDYKAHRPKAPENLVPQFSLIREATRSFNVPVVELEGYEADDIIATYTRLAREAGAKVTIVSSDKDLMQLVDDQVTMFDTLKNRTIRSEEVKEKFGVPPERVIDVQALAGDSTDNIPGVPGIGIKTAALLIDTFGDLESVLQRAGEVRQTKRRENLINHAEDARTSLKLVTLDRHVPVQENLGEFTRREPDRDTLIGFLKSLEFRELMRRVETWLEQNQQDGSPASRREPSYVLVQELADLQSWADRARTAGVVAVDTETTGLNAITAELVGVSLSLESGSGCYIPLAHRTVDLLDPEKQIPIEDARPVLAALLADPAVLKVGHNIKYDSVILARAGMPVSPVDDTMLLSYCLEGALHNHKMDTLAKLFLGRDTIPFKEVAGTGKSQITFDLVPLDKARDYAAEDAEVTFTLWRELKPRIVREKVTRIYETIERPLIPVLADMEQAGIKVDRHELEVMSDEFGTRISGLETEIHDLAGRRFTVSSPKQLGEILFDELGLPGGKRNKSGTYATGADVLEDLSSQGHMLPARVLDWRKLSKLKSTYVDALVEQTNPATGRVHTSFAMAAASTGRLASTDPNLQNIPIRTEEGRRIREAFIAEPGHLLLSADYSQIELRILAHIAEVESLCAAFHDNQDIHTITASQVFSVDPATMDPDTRRRAKAINFGIVYGISPFGLARQLSISREQARFYIDAYFERYPGIQAWIEKTKSEAHDRGLVKTLFGRKCQVPEINSKNYARMSFSERAAVNAPIQGTAADIIKRAMIRIPPILRQQQLGARMLLQVHDELLFEVPEHEVDQTISCIKDVMENVTDLAVPLVVDAGVGHNWKEAH